MPKDNCINVFLIRSGSIPVVSSKLIAYKTFRRAINENEIFLQHEYEDFDDMAKLIANKIFSSFCLYLDLVIHALTNDLHKLMFYNYDKPLKATDIRQMCSDVFNGIAQKYKPFGSTENWRYLSVKILTNNYQVLVSECNEENLIVGVLINLCYIKKGDLKSLYYFKL